MDLHLPAPNSKNYSEYLKFLDIASKQVTLPAKISQPSDPSHFSGRSENSEGTSIDEFRDASKPNNTISSNPEEDTESIAGLDIFSKDSSPNNSKVLLDYSKFSTEKFTTKTEKKIIEEEAKWTKDSVCEMSDEKTEGNQGIFRISELSSEEAMNTDRATEKKEEIAILKRSIRGLQERHQRRESEMKKVIKIQKHKINALENTNLRLFQEINKSKIKCRRTRSDFNIKLINHLQKPLICKERAEQKINYKKKELFYINGSRAEIFSNGYKVIYYSNRDIKQIFPDGRQIYFFSKEQATKTTFLDGVEEIKYKNGQIEKYFPDRTKEIRFPDGRITCIFSDYEEETVFPNGDIEKLDRTGIKSTYYLSGKIKTIFANGEVYHGN